MATIFVPRVSRAAMQALEQHRMAPGEIGADQHDEVGLLEILVAARHGVRAEGAPVAGDRRGHAQAGVGVDIGRADEALHQLVGDVIVLDQQLAGDIEGDAVGAMRRRSSREKRAATRSSASSQLVARAVDDRRAAAGRRATASRRAPNPWSRAGRNWPDAPGRPRSRRRRRRAGARARRSRRRNRGRSCVVQSSASSRRLSERRPSGERRQVDEDAPALDLERECRARGPRRRPAPRRSRGS